MESIEIGTTRPLGTVGRDVFGAAQAAYLHGDLAMLAMGGQAVAFIAPADRVAGPGEFVVHLHDADPSEPCQCGRPGTYARVEPNPFGQG